eukprot:UN06982
MLNQIQLTFACFSCFVVKKIFLFYFDVSPGNPTKFCF